MKETRVMILLLALCVGIQVNAIWAQGPEEKSWEAWELRKRETQDRICGLPERILKKQCSRRTVVPSINDAISQALIVAAKTAEPLIDNTYHTGKRLVVPDAFPSIQTAIDAAEPRDTVLVKPGVYYERIVMKDGIKLTSSGEDDGHQVTTLKGARMSLPRRTFRTIIDGSRAETPETSNRGVIDFNEDVGRHTIIDGFTVQNLPLQDHHIPGHAHAVNARGASPIIMNCYVRHNGSTGMGSHAVYHDQDKRAPERDFRWENVKKGSSGVIFGNIFEGNVGLGIGCNHFSSPYVLGNEVLLNSDAQLGHAPSPGIGIKHGAFPIVIGNIVHHNPGGGILTKTGDPQGIHPVNRTPHPTVRKNVVFENGNTRPGLSARGVGSKETPVVVEGNFVYDSGAVGIGISDGTIAHIERNIVSGSGAPGIEIIRSVAIKLNENQITKTQGPGILIGRGSEVWEMRDNAADGNKGPRFMLRGGVMKNGGQ